MDLQQLIALQKASGGQNVITPENAGRIMGLAAQQEANRQLSLAAGKTAVQEAMDRQIASGERQPQRYGEVDEYGRSLSPLQQQGRVITAPSGAKFVTDAQGNVVGTSAPIGVGAGSTGSAIQKAFQLEMQKPPAQNLGYIPTGNREQNIAAAKKAGVFDSLVTQFNKSAQGTGKMMDVNGNIIDVPAKPTPAKAQVPAMETKEQQDEMLARDYGPEVNAPSPQKAIPALRQALEQQAIKSEKESVATRLSDAERRAQEAMSKFEAGKSSATKEELQALAEEYAAAQAEATLRSKTPEQIQAEVEKMTRSLAPGMRATAKGIAPKGILPELGFSFGTARANISDLFRNAIANPVSEAFTGETAKPSNELYRYLLQQQLLRQAGF